MTHISFIRDLSRLPVTLLNVTAENLLLAESYSTFCRGLTEPAGTSLPAGSTTQEKTKNKLLRPSSVMSNPFA